MLLKDNLKTFINLNDMLGDLTKEITVETQEEDY